MTHLIRVVVVGLLATMPLAAGEAGGEPAGALEANEANARAIERYNAAIVAAQEGRLDESIELLEAFLADGPPEALRDKAGEQLELIRAERRKLHTVEFNEAVKLLKKKRLEDAEQILHGILEDDPDEKMRQSVEKQLTVIERAKPRRALIVGEDDDSSGGDESGESAGTKTDKKRKKKNGS